MKRTLLIASASALVLVSHAAAADDSPTASDASTSASDIGEQLRGYYVGERTSAYVIAAVGGAAAGAGAFLVTRDSDFARGMGWSFIGLGGIEAIGGLGYAIQVNGEIDHYQAALAQDPAAFRLEELAHIHGTVSRFVFYRITEVVLLAAGAGAAIYGFATDRDAWKGAGIGIAGLSLPVVVIDTVNNARAGAYEQELERFRPRIGFTIGGDGRPWSAHVAGRF